jgi:8-oxo-dGTP pyrophosphatase MutT (NUDIX family)
MVLRPDPAGIAVYMIRRSSRSRFMPDAYVFPGGAVDPQDGEAPHAFAIAALRELFEEAGMLIACDVRGARAELDAQTLAHLRASSAAGVPLVELLRARELVLDTRALTYYSNWITPTNEPIRFDAHFFAARAPEGQIAAADAVEVHDGMWVTPADALARAERNELTIRFPTQKHLERLARYRDVDAFFEHALTRKVEPVQPFADGTEVFGFADGEDAW